MRGGGAGVDYWFDHYVRVFARYNYDNRQHSQVVGGLGISFGGVRNGHWADPSLSERLTDPVERYMANLGHGSGIPSQTIRYGRGSGSRIEVLQDNIAFFSETGGPDNGGTNLTLADCTFENPCGPTDFSQAGVNTLNTLLPNTRMYFNGGGYTAGEEGGGSTSLRLNNGQSVHSRTADYSAPATGSDRSAFAGAFTLTGNNVLENIIVLSGGQSSVGVTIEGSNNQIQGSEIGNLGLNFYAVAVHALPGSFAVIHDTDIISNTIGVVAENAELNIQNSALIVDNTTASTGTGVFSDENSVVSIQGSDIVVSGPTTTSNVGVATGSGGMVNVIDSNIDVNNENVITGNAIVLENTNGTINVLESHLNVDATNPFIATGDPVNIGAGTVCVVNGAVVACP